MRIRHQCATKFDLIWEHIQSQDTIIDKLIMKNADLTEMCAALQHRVNELEAGKELEAETMREIIRSEQQFQIGLENIMNYGSDIKQRRAND